MALYFRLLGGAIRTRMQYKLDFLGSTLFGALSTAMEFLSVAVVLYRFHSVGGWGIYEGALLAGTISAAQGLLRIFAAELYSFDRYLLTGDFDILLIRPWPTLASLLSRNFDLGRVGALVQGYLLITLGAGGAGLPGWARLYLFLLPLAGLIILTAISMAVAAAGFWLMRTGELMTMTIKAPASAAAYPMEIFPELMRRLFLSVLPVGAIGYVPLRYLLGKGGGPWALAVPLVAAGLALGMSLQLWRFGERRYQSTGS